MNNSLILVFLVALFWCSSIQAETYPEVNLIKNVVVSDTYYCNCAPSVTCNSTSKYRTIDGTCNNLEHPLWGSTNTPYIRLGPAYYDDGNFTFRLQYKDGMELPGARKLQLELFWPKSSLFDPPDIRNYHVNQIGQFVTHDISLMPSNFAVPPADCCTVQGEENIPYICQAVIKISPLDPSYSEINKTCLPFRRAMTASFDFNCEITPQIPVNQQTAFVDASQVYGPTAAKADSLRSHKLGRLKTEMIDGQEFGAQDQRNGSTFCGGRTNVTYCFDRGDPRKNQHFGLILYEETFLRFHNLIAGLLLKENPDWSDEILYQEARRIIIAALQIIVYRDYLPVLLDENNEIVEQFKLNEYMTIPDPLISGSKLEELLRGMTFLPGRCPLASYNLLVSSRMFHNWISTVADLDLLSIDIQRGRDIGLPPYIRVREICGFPNITSFSDLANVLKPIDLFLLQKCYDSVEDIDLLVGALLEPNVDGAMVGETARCIIADGFYRIRYGDRLFCDVESQPGSFTKEQLDVLWSLDLTQIFCLTTNIDKLPSDIFTPNGLSGTYSCESIQLDLAAWKDK
ncbi:chorion peroxidase-like isoform X2 [Metopolophium dirhodum]|uniref:chorion peroxidase-like isoform X2 n=1 Tax=Metopolophium dirhodum TaxID=44670 RepID=UPI00298F9085|nr:chorion peroxidase-like isoform X2 [Metopolophium dirhodum]